MKIAGFDIGGANTDLAVIDFDLHIFQCGVIMMIYHTF